MNGQSDPAESRTSLPSGDSQPEGRKPSSSSIPATTSLSNENPNQHPNQNQNLQQTGGVGVGVGVGSGVGSGSGMGGPSPIRTRKEAPRPDLNAPRNLVLCFDGTGNEFGANLTNVPILFSFLADHEDRQRCYYQTGVGTWSATSTAGFAIWNTISSVIDLAVAWNLPEHVQDGYRFLMEEYRPGDRIFLFGFSRGAYTARALAGMLQQVGLLFPGNPELVSQAYKIYARGPKVMLYPGPDGETLADGFKRTFARAVTVHFIGVWDTVASVGAILSKTLPFASSSRQIAHFRQALALDERRARYAEQVWMPPAPTLHPNPNATTTTTATTTATYQNNSGGDGVTNQPKTDVKERWFVGAHSDVGGGQTSTDGDRTPRLSHISLKWMMKEACQNGLYFDEEILRTSRIFIPFLPMADLLMTNSDTLGEMEMIQTQVGVTGETPFSLAIVTAAASQEAINVSLDAFAPRGDALSFSIKEKPRNELVRETMGMKWSDFIHRCKQRGGTLCWWVLEGLPTYKRLWSIGSRKLSWSMMPNIGKGRILPIGAVCHISVLYRQEATATETGYGNGESVPESVPYLPKVRLQQGQSWNNMTYDA